MRRWRRSRCRPVTAAFQRRLYDEYRVEVPVIEWGGRQFVRVSVQGYNTAEDVEALVRALHDLLSQQPGHRPGTSFPERLPVSKCRAVSRPCAGRPRPLSGRVNLGCIPSQPGFPKPLRRVARHDIRRYPVEVQPRLRAPARPPACRSPFSPAACPAPALLPLATGTMHGPRNASPSSSAPCCNCPA